MKNSIRLMLILVISLVFLGGCASQIYHDYIMSGQIVSVKEDSVVICVADTEGLNKGDIFNVYRTVADPTAIDEGDSGYKREFVGKIRLGDKKEKHFANATVVTGEMFQHDMIEFDKD